MRSVVALVEARPETIIDDYRRVIELAKLSNIISEHPVTLVPQIKGADWLSGVGTAPWQIDGVLNSLAGMVPNARDISVLPAADRGELGKMSTKLSSGFSSSLSSCLSSNAWAWDNVLSSYGATLTADSSRATVPVVPSVPVPALGAVLADGFSIPAALQGRRPLLLPVPQLNSQWAVTGAVSLLKDLLVTKTRKARNIPFSEIVAELVSFAGNVLPASAVVMDATLWQIPAGSPAGASVARNVLIAGTDPVAVDAVAIKLTGLNPMSQPWLQLCSERGLGAVSDNEIKIVGRTDLLELDFDLKIDRLPSSASAKGFARWGGNLWRATAGKSVVRRRQESVWGRLYTDYRDGRKSGSGKFEEKLDG